jgi:hypothetical protein
MGGSLQSFGHTVGIALERIGIEELPAPKEGAINRS